MMLELWTDNYGLSNEEEDNPGTNESMSSSKISEKEEVENDDWKG